MRSQAVQYTGSENPDAILSRLEVAKRDASDQFSSERPMSDLVLQAGAAIRQTSRHFKSVRIMKTKHVYIRLVK